MQIALIDVNPAQKKYQRVFRKMQNIEVLQDKAQCIDHSAKKSANFIRDVAGI